MDGEASYFLYGRANGVCGWWEGEITSPMSILWDNVKVQPQPPHTMFYIIVLEYFI